MKTENESTVVIKEGFMVKKGHMRHNWKSRWFVLQHNMLTYYKAKGGIIPKGQIKLKGCSVISPDPEYIKKDCVFRLIEILGTEFLLQCSNQEEQESWVQEISGVIRKLESLLAKTDSIKYSDRLSLSSPEPVTEPEAPKSQMLVILQNRVTHGDLLTAMQDIEAGISLRNYHVGNDVYKLCFSGDNLVTWLVSWAFVQTREEGRVVAGELLEKAFLHPVGPVSDTFVRRRIARQAFCDNENALYRFSSLNINSGLDMDFDLSDSSDESDDELIFEDFQATVVKQGFLVKKGHVRHNWKVRKFILYDEPARFSYFNPTKGTKGTKGRIKLFGSKVQALRDDDDVTDTSCTKGCKNVFREHCFLLQTKKGSKYILQAPSEVEMKDWVKLLRDIILKFDVLNS